MYPCVAVRRFNRAACCNREWWGPNSGGITATGPPGSPCCGWGHDTFGPHPCRSKEAAEAEPAPTSPAPGLALLHHDPVPAGPGEPAGGEGPQGLTFSSKCISFCYSGVSPHLDNSASTLIFSLDIAGVQGEGQ